MVDLGLDVGLKPLKILVKEIEVVLAANVAVPSMLLQADAACIRTVVPFVGGWTFFLAVLFHLSMLSEVSLLNFLRSIYIYTHTHIYIYIHTS